MKTLRVAAISIASLFFFIISCQREVQPLSESEIAARGNQPAAPESCTNPYIVTLESKVADNGNWIWTWSIYNPNPGNGLNGTAQDMSHWGMQFGSCFIWDDVVSAAYSFNGTDWTSFTPAYVVDPSQSCVTTPVLKFNAGTNGSDKTYYQLVLSQNYSIDPNAFAYFKSGSRLPCCTFTFNGVGCPIDGWCAFSQGYWFARPETVWCQDVTFGSNSYTQAQGQNIWNNAPPNSVAKKAFTQASALQLSMACHNNGDPIPGDILSAYNTCVNFLAGLTYNDILTGLYPASSNQSVATAAGAIGTWIPLNHCEE